MVNDIAAIPLALEAVTPPNELGLASIAIALVMTAAEVKEG